MQRSLPMRDTGPSSLHVVPPETGQPISFIDRPFQIVTLIVPVGFDAAMAFFYHLQGLESLRRLGHYRPFVPATVLCLHTGEGAFEPVPLGAAKFPGSSRFHQRTAACK